MLSVHPSFTAEPYALARKGEDWLLAGLTVKSARRPHHAADILQLYCRVRVAVAQDGKERLWCGEVVERDDDQATLSLWGSGERLVIPLPTVLRAAVVPRHTHAEHREVCERQRRGEPARVLGKAPHFVLVSDDLAAQVGDFATARGLTESEAVGQLVSVALRRLGALQRWNEKVRSRRAGSETRTDRQGTP